MTDSPHTRRRLLATLGSLAGTGALAGCTNVLGDSDDDGSESNDENAGPEGVLGGGSDEVSTDGEGTGGNSTDEGTSDGEGADGESTDDDSTGGDTSGDSTTESSWVEPPSSTDEWERQTENDAEVAIRAPDALDLQVHKCSTAEVSTRVADGTGTLRIAFDYVTMAQEWHERPWVAVVEGGEARNPLADDPDDSIDVTEYESAEGSVDTTVEVDGAVDLHFGIEPSSHCSNGDHADTHLRVRNLVVEEAESN